MVTSASSSSSLSAPAPTGRWTYDVFLSFRGEDTRNNFVDHLYAALDGAGIYTFKDDEKLPRGKSISPELVKAIQESMVAVVVFSKNYAHSSWCLEELAKIIEWRDLMGQLVLPVFYDVDPSVVRGQKGSFHTAFQQHEVNLIDDMEKVKSWRKALVTSANLYGWNVSKTSSGREAECIKQIVRNILSYTQCHPAENMIGMESRVRHVKSLLDRESDDVRIIGIWGMGGIGKTTIARAVYHQISNQFEGSSFLEDVRENGSNNKGLKSLQEKLLSEILMVKDFTVKDCQDGICQIRRRMSRKKALVVLDDVDNIKQLEFLAGGREWFGPGSRILLTTRDEHLLSGAQEKYAPELLKETEAMKLFSRYAFKLNIPPKAYEELSRDVVTHTGHLPLALKVLGSHFCGRDMDFWRSALNVLAKIPHKEIMGILKISYDGLNILEKKIFLHIACFYKGREIRHVTRILDSFGFEAVSGIAILIEKSLLTISKGSLDMHDLIQEMGRCISRESCPTTMVWVLEEIEGVMTEISKLETVEAIVATTHYHLFHTTIPVCCNADIFKSMKKLRLLQVSDSFTSGKPSYFPEQLRWLSWFWYPFNSLRITRDMTKLVGLEMQSSSMKQLNIENKVILTNLKFMNLHNSRFMTTFPDVSGVPNLEGLNLSNCCQLMEVHNSVFLHKNISHLNLSSCFRLKYLSFSMYMKSLQVLLLKDCKSLERFPEVSEEMGRLLVLNIDGCGRLRTLPSSSRLFTGLIVLSTFGCEGLEHVFKKQLRSLHIQGWTNCRSLRILDLSQNNLVEDDFPLNLHNAWPSLEELNLSGNLLTMLPSSISQIPHLKYLDLSDCEHLKELHELPLLIQVLRADHCTSLKKIGDLSNKYKWLFQISLVGIYTLRENQKSQQHLCKLMMKSVVQKCAVVNRRLSIAIPGSSFPKFFSNQQLGNTISLHIPQDQITRMKGLAICCLFQSLPMVVRSSFKITFRPSGQENFIGSPERDDKAVDLVWIGYISIEFLQNLCNGFESDDLFIRVDSAFYSIVKCAVCVVYKDDIKGMTGTGSLVPDYDILRRIDCDNVSNEDLQHGRWSVPSFSFGLEKYGNHNSVHIDL